MNKKEEIELFAEKRPQAKAVFGYGSGVFKQETRVGTPQTDVIFVVDDIKKWHEDNMQENKDDYSFIGKIHFSTSNLRRLKGKNFITYFSEIKDKDIGALFKYGVIQTDDFFRGLSTWDNMFLVGRFHKPVLDVTCDQELKSIINENRDRAFRIACLLSEPVTDKFNLYKLLCGLSYMGDTRMKFAENPNKVNNIVKGSYKVLECIYDFSQPYVLLLENDRVVIDHNLLLREIECLPKCLVDYLAEYDTDLKDLNDVRLRILEFIVEHNKEESKAQILEGIKTNGVVRSIPYVFGKLKRRIGK